ncbi:GspE/PulE family protein [Methylocystis sp. MJC1]|jgi:general secretion pathway protein E|uniref:GspE/PulE family protein n=1 Tax=Methylocystis sp. MJC1 TaxID=2654282 RepID=UPI0013EAEA3D|nr:GspE/PulE family protein [Methylocystis sp. MJC1]KAF2992325.1 Type II secretion system protein E [Methylocystis sp. MJC1]MBU6527463.1 type II/IV secretion system protein [Methylocystis sp. MJC1]UZX10409.1 GspE/PulE family protein [Methylocystis sp. MJC1]
MAAQTEIPGQTAHSGPNAWPDANSPEFAEAFGGFILSEKAIDELALQRSQRAALQSGERFDQVLTKLGLVSEVDLCGHLGKFLGIPQLEPSEVPMEPPLRAEIPEKFIHANRLLPLAVEGRRLRLAVTDPLDLEPVQALSYSTGYEIELRLATPAQFDKAWSSLYGARQDGVSLVDNDARANDASEFDLQRLRDIANEAPVVRRVNQIIGDAIEARASDIHIEPSLEAVQVRYRIDGALRTAETLPPGLKAAIASRIKIMARLDIAERRLPQDGRIKLAIRGVDIDFRVSTLPTAHGESIVLRILDRSQIALDFDRLGFEPQTTEQLRKVMRNPNGIVLVTGPTGSGKTTTLYTALKELTTPDVKVFTVEDPIEYQLAGVNQVQVQPGIGLDFPNTLRAILRQDPDIIMIGEIRDAETAKIAIQASLTGHLVFSTLHTNSAAASITRLIDMGVENYLIASTVKAVLAQRLVRRLCQCAGPLETRTQVRAQFAGEAFAKGPDRLSSPRGCPNCRNLGYTGRSTIAELLIMNERMQRLVCESAPDAQLEAAAREAGMITMYQCGMTKAWRGETTIEEVARVTRMD